MDRQPQRVNEVMQVLTSRRTQAAETSVVSRSVPTLHPSSSRGSDPGKDAYLPRSRSGIFKRIEEDRERHK